MASGDIVVHIIKEMPTESNTATFDLRGGGSTPAEGLSVYDYDASTIEYRDYLCYLNGYSGGGLTFVLPWMASSATSNEVRIGIGIRALVDDAEDIDSPHSYDYNEVDDTAPSASGELSYPTITFADGADMDSWANGQLAVVRVRRDASHANDDMAGDMELICLIGKET